MTKRFSNHQTALVAGTLLVFPATYFVLAALLNYGLGFSALWALIDPIFEKQVNKQLGWNVNLLILFGPILAFVWNFFSIVRIKWINEKDRLQLNFSIRKHWLNIALAIVSVLILATLFSYLIAENCR